MTRRAALTLALCEDAGCNLPDGTLPEAVPEPSALGREWAHAFASEESQRGVLRTFGISPTDAAAWRALGRIGACFADVFGFEGEKGEAPRWRWRLYHRGKAVEVGFDAIVLPIDRLGRIVRALDRGDDAWPPAYDVADLIAIPVSGGVARSYTGLTTAVGSFAPELGKVTLIANGLRWLRLYVQRARAEGEEWPEHLVDRSLEGLLPPDSRCAFILAPALIEWRPGVPFSVIADKVHSIACPDSAGLARLVDAALTQKEKPKPMPQVLGPAQRVAA